MSVCVSFRAKANFTTGGSWFPYSSNVYDAYAVECRHGNETDLNDCEWINYGYCASYDQVQVICELGE